MRDEYFDDDVYTSSRPTRRGRVSSREERYNEDISAVSRANVRKSSRSSEPVSVNATTFKYAALAVLVIVAVISTIVFMRVGISISLIIAFIMVLLGVFLHTTPVFISILLDAVILIAGMLTKTSNIVICASCVYLATILVFKED